MSYLVTHHTWTCEGTPPHEITISDGGRPQRSAVKRAVIQAWVACKNEKCSTCGAKVTYRATESQP